MIFVLDRCRLLAMKVIVEARNSIKPRGKESGGVVKYFKRKIVKQFQLLGKALANHQGSGFGRLYFKRNVLPRQSGGGD